MLNPRRPLPSRWTGDVAVVDGTKLRLSGRIRGMHVSLGVTSDTEKPVPVVARPIDRAFLIDVARAC